LSGREPPGDLDDAALAHAVYQQVGFAVEQDRAPDFVTPVIIMSQPPQARLDAAGDDRHALEGLAGPLTIRQRGAIRPPSDLAARAVGIVVADFAVGGVVVDHRVHVARADRKEQPRPAECPPGIARVPVRLTENRHAKTGTLEQPPQQRHGEARMIDIGIAADKHHIHIVPPAREHFGPRHRQRRRRLDLRRQRRRRLAKDRQR
jgi:hypothetical protein